VTGQGIDEFDEVIHALRFVFQHQVDKRPRIAVLERLDLIAFAACRRGSDRLQGAPSLRDFDDGLAIHSGRRGKDRSLDKTGVGEIAPMLLAGLLEFQDLAVRERDHHQRLALRPRGRLLDRRRIETRRPFGTAGMLGPNPQ